MLNGNISKFDNLPILPHALDLISPKGQAEIVYKKSKQGLLNLLLYNGHFLNDEFLAAK